MPFYNFSTLAQKFFIELDWNSTWSFVKDDAHLINEDGVCGIHDYDKVMHDLCNFYISYTFFSELGWNFT